MFGVEHAVDAGEGNVFVAPTVARDVVEIEQLVVVGAGWLNRACGADRGVCIRHLAWTWSGVMGDVVQEGVAGAQGVGRAHRCCPVAF